MKELSLDEQIYLCKYHDIDNKLLDVLGLTDKETEELINYYKKRGLYEQYRKLSEEEYSHVVKNEYIKAKVNETKKAQPKNQLLYLNDILFEQLHVLIDDSLTQEELKQEINRSKQVVAVSQTIINNADLLLQAKKHFDNTGTKVNEVASLLRLE